MRVALVGYFGYGNVGDEAILHSMIGQLKCLDPVPEILIFSNTPEKTGKQYNVLSMRRMSLPSVMAGISMADLVIFAGGTLFQDRTSFRNLVYYLGVLAISRLYRRKVILYAQGVEPLKHWFSRLLVREFFMFVDHISVRDTNSLFYLKETLKLKKRVHFVMDSALMLFPHKTHNRYQQRIGLNLMQAFNFPLQNVSDTLSRFYQDTGVPFVYFPFNATDREVGKRLQGLMPVGSIIMAEPQGDLLTYMGDIGQLELMIGARLHSLIFSAAAQTPFVGINVHDKVESFCQELNQPCLVMPDLQNGILYSNLMQAWQRRAEHGRQLKQLLEAIKEKSKDNFINNILVRYEA